MDNKKPLVSIITPTLNRAEFLEKAIQSVIAQDYENIEHIIIDGLSTDGTLDILKKYEKKYNLRWISEKDKNQTDAWNKGIKMAKGEFLGWCCSDDYYKEGAVGKIVDAFEKNPGIDLAFGACQELNYQTGKFETVFRNDPEKIKKITPDDILYGREALRQPALFYRRRIIEKTGFLTPDIKFMMDYDWEYRMLKNGAKVMYIDEILAIIGQHPGRGSIKAAAKGIKASMDFIRFYGGKVPFGMKVSYLRWRYPLVPNFLKKYTPQFLSFIKKIINKF
jgi:glycosyltransferase involved in cell wall biosynthesis